MGSLETATTQPGHTMGTKLSKATNTPPADKSSTLPAPHNDEDESKVAVQSESLPRSGFERTTGLGKSFRKSMRKLVGKKKVKEEETEKKESAAGEQTESTVEAAEKEDFKTAQQKARAEFFKEMYTDEEKEEKEETTTTEEEKKEDKEEVPTTTEVETTDQEEEAVNVSLIGTPCADEKEEDVGVGG